MILPPWLWRLVHSRKLWILSISTPLLGLVLFYTVANAWGTRKLDQARKEISAKGYALTWDEVVKSGVAPEDDLLRHLVMLERPPDIQSELVGKGYGETNLSEWIQNPSGGKRFSAAAVCGRPAAEEFDSFVQLIADLAGMEPTAAEIKAAVRSSKGIGWRISGKPALPENPWLSTVAWTSTWIPRRAVLRAAGGDNAGAMDDLQVFHEYLELLHAEPRTLFAAVIGTGMTSMFSNSASQIAQMPSVSREQLQRISQWLDSLDTAQPLIDSYQREMVFMNNLISSHFGSITALPPDQMYLNFSWMDARNWWKEGKNLWWQVRPVGLFKSELANALQQFDRDFLHAPGGGKRSSWTAQDAERIERYAESLPDSGSNHLGIDRCFFDSHLDIAPSAIRKALKTRTILRLCRSGIAAELYRRDHGRLPLAMGELVPDYLAEMPVDALSEAPIRMETNADGGITFMAKDKDLRILIPAR